MCNLDKEYEQWLDLYNKPLTLNEIDDLCEEINQREEERIEREEMMRNKG